MDAWRPICLKNKNSTGSILLFSPRMFWNCCKESNGVGTGEVTPPELRHFFKILVFNGAMLTLFFIFFTFSNKKVGIVRAFFEK